MQRRFQTGQADAECDYTMTEKITTSCKKCTGSGQVGGMLWGTNPCGECQGKGSITKIVDVRRRLEDDVNPLTALCAWALMLFIVALVYIVDRQMKMRKHDALQAGRFSRTAT